jgi:glucan phosphoethanolaminetransferase (alkaline phosphatase superfamily)
VEQRSKGISGKTKYHFAYLGLLLLLCITAMLFDQLLHLERLRQMAQNGLYSSLWSIGVKALLYALAVLGITQMLLLVNFYLRLLAQIILFLSLACSVAFYLVEGRRTLAPDIAVVVDGLFSTAALPTETFLSFWRPLGITFIVSALLVMLFSLIAGKIRRSSAKLPSTPIILTLFFGISALLLAPPYRGWVNEAPLYNRNILYAVLELINEDSLYAGKRSVPGLPVERREDGIRHIIYIMDESILGTCLSLNGYEIPTTPFLLQNAGKLHNYGLASSSGNLSKISNIICISGLMFDELPDSGQRGLKQASIFDYANQAGRESFYVDVQRAARSNYIMPRDMRSFNYIKVFPDGQNYNLDMKAVDIVEKIVSSADSPTFIFLLKWGCHFDYQGRFNPELAYPGLRRDGFIPEAYLKALHWSVDVFFHKLFQKLSGEDVLVFYTSDHGQSFDAKSSYPHGTVIDPPVDQATVPLLIWPFSENAEDVFSRCGGYNPQQYNQASHFQIFPTILTAMGYNREEVIRRFGSDLFGAPSPKRAFLSGDVFYSPSSYTTYRINDFPTIADAKANAPAAAMTAGEAAR